jgi:hypothetical protein
MLFEKFFGPLEEASAEWGIFVAAEVGEFLEFLALFGIQFGRDFDYYAHEQVTMAAAVDVYNPFAAELEYLTRLGAGGDFEIGFALQRRYRDFAA